ncbi:sorting nexin [Holotrichia oblita]|uniref:Sorting nexin n=1 Tax=Holotrichia oblita TaxID=644536 RepID=A0ACB9T6Y1_HOLOL|nr:sorting nexin [Holotrichia oblita]
MGIERVQQELEVFRNNLMHDYDLLKTKSPQNHLPVIFGRTLDSLLQQLLDYLIRDYIFYYFKKYAYKPELSRESIKEDLWGAIEILHERFSRVDHAKLMACDVVLKITNHFERIREAKILVAESDHYPLFKLSPHLLSKQKELEYLRQVSELLMMFLLPRGYLLSPAKYFLREVLACKAQKVTAAIHRKTFEYANSFEDFLKMIQKSNDVELLKRFRYDIVTKIMQATTLQNLKRAKGVDPDIEKGSSTTTINKSEINAARKLKRYITQLTFAKKECEKRLSELGWDIGYQYQDEKVLPLSTILDNVLGRRYLTQFLETVASEGLVGYYITVEELKSAQRKNWHQIGAEIFYTYIKNPTGEIKVDKFTKKRMEEFLLGDKGPEVFYEVQHQVVQIIEDKYYQPFIHSEFYKKMLIAIESEDVTEVDGTGSSEERPSSGDSVTQDNSLHVGDHSNYARRKLDQLQEKLNNKVQVCQVKALQALKSSLKPESRVLSILEKEVEWLQGERRQLEAHLERTEIWGENLGKWRAVAQSAEGEKNKISPFKVVDEKDTLVFVIIVDMIEKDSVEGEEEISSGWVVSRTLTQFQELHRKLRPLCSNLKSLELPSQSFKFLFGKNDKNSLEKAKAQIQKYLQFILEDDRLNQSEAIYSFLSPSSEHLKHTTPSTKKSKFSFSTLFKSNSNELSSKDATYSLRESEDEDISQYLDGSGSVDSVDVKLNGVGGKIVDDGKDSIAEPLYSLMSEIFDMRGLFKYLRKTLIAFVQITYGRTINRQIYDTISWCFSEQMLHYYITLVIKSWWPAGVLAGPKDQRLDDIRKHTAREAREQFINNVPEVLITLVGASAARNGARKIFDTLQNKMMNKQLFYDLLETIMIESFPELNINI